MERVTELSESRKLPLPTANLGQEVSATVLIADISGLPGEETKSFRKAPASKALWQRHRRQFWAADAFGVSRRRCSSWKEYSKLRAAIWVAGASSPATSRSAPGRPATWRWSGSSSTLR